MTSGAPPSQMLSPQGKRTSFGGFPGSNASHLLERSKPGLRGSTPDSEALASSDDEPDQLHRLAKVTSNPSTKPTRRPSWLTEGQQVPNRNPSVGGNVPFSPISPGSAVPSSDQIPWGSNVGPNQAPALGRGPPNSASFPWANTIWNTETSKGPPQRLSEVMPSPTTVLPSGSASLYGDEHLVSPREPSSDQAIPFPIPLQPTLKTYRSQSYSVGQLDPETTKVPPVNYGGHGAYPRPRVGTSYAGLQHRPSRPSMLGEASHDPKMLSQLREVEDDEESVEISDPGMPQSSDSARTIEQLTKENAMLRQAAAASQLTAISSQQNSLRNRRTSRGGASEGSDQAILETDEIDSQNMYAADALNGRRFSEYGVKPTGNYPFSNQAEHRNMEGAKKGQWQSSLGFSGVGEPPQSRRHSFAEVPTRQNSTGPGNGTHSGRGVLDVGLAANGKPMSPEAYGTQGDGGEYQQFRTFRDLAERSLEHKHLQARAFAARYFSRMDPNMRGGDEHRTPSSTALHHAYAQGGYGRHQAFPVSYPRPKPLLYIVTFKCQRADVFFVEEGMGLQVNKGDLVIVEADRGTDLGTVASDNVEWAEAKELKDKFIEEHHRWLMMFSQHGQNGTVAGQNPNGAPQNTVIGASSGQAGGHDVPTGELKPKKIKRVALQHEIQSLREKEGAEAKAKRACQQKVVEHRLRMEILDAEFQMDWKKLTFFYFAETYINFNALVTDLFKIYKTRIWMSAINTAAIASPSGGHHMMGGPSQRHYSPEVDEYPPRHQPRRNQDSPSIGQPPAGFQNAEHLWSQNEYGTVTGPPNLAHLYGQAMPGAGFDIRQMPHMHMGAYGPPAGAMPAFYNANDYGNNPQAKPPGYNPQTDGRVANPRERADGGDWNQSFQRLTLDH